MPDILENYSIKGLNTLGVEASARYFVEIKSEGDLKELFTQPQWKNINRLILGGGSNILFTRNFDGLVIKMAINGVHSETMGEHIYVTAGGGVVWNDLVSYCVERGFAGMENLSLIPGSVGASPVQNIGAYGVELKDIFQSCKVFEIATGEMRRFNFSDCQFGYRDSIFKQSLKNKVIITEVTYRLSTQVKLNTSYGAIEQELHHRKIQNPTIKDIAQVVYHIRVAKLPDPSTIGNAGSFFKNPIINVAKLRQLQSVFPDIVHYPLNDEIEKIAAGWLIEKCGWKGKKIGETGTWKNQALVIVNHGSAKGSDIYNLSQRIITDVKNQFDIELEYEVNII